jgi:hypothetical protein
MSKPRSDSVLDGLPKNQKDALDRWMREENLSYKDAVSRLWKDFNVTTSRSALQRWWEQRENDRSRTEALERISQAAHNAKVLQKRFDENPSPLSAVSMNLVCQKAFEELMKGKIDVDAVESLLRLALSAQDQELKARKVEQDERKLKLMEAKAKQADEAEKTLGDSKLTTEEREKRMRQIFGLQ